MPTTPLNDTAPRVQYEAAAGQTEFTFPFWVTAEADLNVYAGNTLQTLNTDYTATGILNINGGTVVFTNGRPAGEVITIERAMPFERVSEFQEAGTFKASVLNLELSKMVAMMQQVKGDIGRKLGLSATSRVAAANLVLPDPQDGKALVFDGTGGAMRTSVVNVDNIDSAVLDAQTAAGAATSARDTALQAETDAQSARLASESARDEAMASVGNVLVSTDDTTAGKLVDKLDGITIQNPAGNEKAVVYPPIGMPFPLWENLTGVTAPDNSGTAKFIKLTAGLTGTGAYNEGLLTSESVSGSAPEVTATAQIVGGDLDGETVHLINTEESFLRARTTSGALQQDQMQRITGAVNEVSSTAVGPLKDSASDVNGVFSKGGTVTNVIQGSTNGTGRELDFDSANSPNARTSSSTNGETRSKNVSATYFMRII